MPNGWPTKDICPLFLDGTIVRDSHYRKSPTRRGGFEPAQNLNLDFVEWSCVVVLTTTPRCHVIYFPECIVQQALIQTIRYLSEFGTGNKSDVLALHLYIIHLHSWWLQMLVYLAIICLESVVIVILKCREVNSSNPFGNYMLKVSNRKTRTRCELCSKLPTKTPERHATGVVLASLLLNWSIFQILLWCLCC